MRLAHDFPILVIGIAWRQRHQYGMSTLRAYIINIFAHITTVGIYCFLLSRFFDGYMQGVITCAGNTGTCTSLVVRTVVVMSDRDDDPVTRTDSLTDGFP